MERVGCVANSLERKEKEETRERNMNVEKEDMRDERQTRKKGERNILPY